MSVEPSRSARAISDVSASSHCRRFAMPVSPSTSACRSTMRRSRAFSSAIAAWEASELAASRCSSSNDCPAIVSVPNVVRPAVRSNVSVSPPASGSPVSTTRAVVCEQARAVGAGRLDGGLDDHAQLLVDVVRRSKSFAEARDRVA